MANRVPEKDLRLRITDRFKPRTDREFVAKVVRAALEFTGRVDCEVSILLTDDDEIARVHGEFLDDPTPTDVMSFDLDDSIELIISVECARREAERLQHTIRAELALYVVHGLLHACDYDDHDAAERERMRAAEREVLARIGQRVSPVDEQET